MIKTRGNAMPWWGWAVWVLTVAVSIAVYPHLPARIATHFGVSGQPNAYSSRFIGVTIIPVVTLAIMLLWQFLWKVDPKRKNYAEFWATYRLVGGIIAVFFGMIQVWLITYELQDWLSPVRLLPTFIGLLLLLLSNLLPRIQPNWWLGVRTPWTLSSEQSWRRTHRLAGNLGIPAGILMIGVAWVLPASSVTWALLVLILLWAAIPVVASYFYAHIEQ